MAKDINLLSYWMPLLRQLKEFKEIAHTEETELRYLLEVIDRTISNMYMESADEYGISRFENILGILPYAEDTLESRRGRIQSRWFASIPYTMRTLTEKLITLCGENNFIITKEFTTYQIYIDTHLELFGQVEELERLLQSMMPCNMVVCTKNKIISSVSGTTFMIGGVTYEECIVATDKEEV